MLNSIHREYLENYIRYLFIKAVRSELTEAQVPRSKKSVHFDLAKQKQAEKYAHARARDSSEIILKIANWILGNDPVGSRLTQRTKALFEYEIVKCLYDPDLEGESSIRRFKEFFENLNQIYSETEASTHIIPGSGEIVAEIRQIVQGIYDNLSQVAIRLLVKEEPKKSRWVKPTVAGELPEIRISCEKKTGVLCDLFLKTMRYFEKITLEQPVMIERQAVAHDLMLQELDVETISGELRVNYFEPRIIKDEYRNHVTVVFYVTPEISSDNLSELLNILEICWQDQSSILAAYRKYSAGSAQVFTSEENQVPQAASANFEEIGESEYVEHGAETQQKSGKLHSKPSCGGFVTGLFTTLWKKSAQVPAEVPAEVTVQAEEAEETEKRVLHQQI